jgi:hypothetical protein
VSHCASSNLGSQESLACSHLDYSENVGVQGTSWSGLGSTQTGDRIGPLRVLRLVVLANKLEAWLNVVYIGRRVVSAILGRWCMIHFIQFYYSIYVINTSQSAEVSKLSLIVATHESLMKRTTNKETSTRRFSSGVSALRTQPLDGLTLQRQHQRDQRVTCWIEGMPLSIPIVCSYLLRTHTLSRSSDRGPQYPNLRRPTLESGTTLESDCVFLRQHETGHAARRLPKRCCSLNTVGASWSPQLNNRAHSNSHEQSDAVSTGRKRKCRNFTRHGVTLDTVRSLSTGVPKRRSMSQTTRLQPTDGDSLWIQSFLIRVKNTHD